MTKIINIKSGEKYDIYIGRSGHGKDGYFGNPFIIGKHGNREEVLKKYKEYFYKKIVTDQEFKDKILSLNGKILGCFCDTNDKEITCHGQIIQEYLIKYNSELLKFDKKILNNEPWLKKILEDATKYKLAVVGSRGITQATPIFKFLDDRINKIEMIISGGCENSPDEVANHWCKARGIPILIFYPDWKKLGRSAGMKRNIQIIQSADKVVAFYDGQSKGTANSIEIANELKKPCKIILMSQTNQEIIND